MTVDATLRKTPQSAEANVRASWKDYLNLAKPRMVLINLITALGGFWVASRWQIDVLLMFYMLAGTALIMGSACVFNNVIDRDHDIRMERTKHRAIPSGRISVKQAVIYGTVLGLLGIAILFFLVNPVSALLGLIGHFAYVVIYTYWLKPRSTWSTSVGGIAGSAPPMIGYCAVSGTVDAGAVLLFILMFCWQPPHFWALGIRKVEEYRKADYKVLPVVKGVRRTKIQMIPYLVVMFPATILLYTLGYVGVVFLVGALILLTAWSWVSISGLFTKDDKTWAIRTFKYSLYYLVFVFILMILDTPHISA